MAEVNINDSTIKRFVVTCHKFDPETNHFRWMPEIAFNRKRDWNRYWDRWVKDLELRSKMGTSHSKEQISGYILDVGDIKKSIVEIKTSYRFQLILPKFLRQKRFLPNYESAWTEYKALYPEG